SVDVQALLLAERLARYQSVGERVELLAVRGEQPLRLFVAVVDDPPDLGIDGLGGGFAERPFAGVTTRAAEIWVFPRRELHHAEAVAHAPSRHHPACEVGRLLDIVLCSGGLG